MSDLTTHEVLVATLNSMEHEGINMMNYGLSPHSACGTQRCMLGWTGWHAGVRESAHADTPRPQVQDGPPEFRRALRVLALTAPEVSEERLLHGMFLIDDEAFDRPLTADEFVESTALGLPCETRDEMVLDWVRRAVAVSAPAPADPVGPDPSGLGSGEMEGSDRRSPSPDAVSVSLGVGG